MLLDLFRENFGETSGHGNELLDEIPGRDGLVLRAVGLLYETAHSSDPSGMAASDAAFAAAERQNQVSAHVAETAVEAVVVPIDKSEPMARTDSFINSELSAEDTVAGNTAYVDNLTTIEAPADKIVVFDDYRQRRELAEQKVAQSFEKAA